LIEIYHQVSQLPPQSRRSLATVWNL